MMVLIGENYNTIETVADIFMVNICKSWFKLRYN